MIGTLKCSGCGAVWTEAPGAYVFNSGICKFCMIGIGPSQADTIYALLQQCRYPEDPDLQALYGRVERKDS